EWKECLIFNGVEINDSDFNKFWLNIYIRYDTCTNQDSKHADKNCSLKNFEKLIEKDIFDLEHNNLDELKSFFKCFV
ncbi:MAG: hypothetical protein ORN58_06285, partial [Sediminibacterium sp.]|nr:hypothetical protein [Sediminibacterium sp.]